MKRHKLSEARAKAAARFLQAQGVDGVKIGVVLGTGWGNAMPWDEGELVRIPFVDIPGFHPLGELDGHSRTLLFGRVDGVPVVALQGRVHPNEAPASPQVYENVRLQIEMLLQLGVNKLVITSAVGSLTSSIEVGQLVSPDGFITVFAPDMPLYAGEFVDPEGTLVGAKVVERVNKEGVFMHAGGHAMVRGPLFEGRRYDKAMLERTGASVVGMSLLPECCIAALYDAKALPLCFVTNTASELHSHEVNQERATGDAAKRTMCNALAASVKVLYNNLHNQEDAAT